MFLHTSFSPLETFRLLVSGSSHRKIRNQSFSSSLGTFLDSPFSCLRSFSSFFNSSLLRAVKEPSGFKLIGEILIKSWKSISATTLPVVCSRVVRLVDALGVGISIPPTIISRCHFLRCACWSFIFFVRIPIRWTFIGLSSVSSFSETMTPNCTFRCSNRVFGTGWNAITSPILWFAITAQPVLSSFRSISSLSLSASLQASHLLKLFQLS